MPNMFKCNICRTGRCSKATFKMYERIGSSESCQLFDRATPLRVPLLVHAMSNTEDARPIVDLLDRFGFTVEEKGKYPYFELKRKSNE